jgi:hypothetical protein
VSVSYLNVTAEMLLGDLRWSAHGAAVVASCTPDLQAVEIQVDDRCGVQHQHLAEDQAAHNRDAQGPAQLRARAGAERQRQAPNRAAMVVMMIGRNRSRQAWKMAASGLFCSVRSASSAKSIIIIAFFFTMPMSRMIPMMAMKFKSVLQSCSASRAPTPADGSVDRMVSGCM